MDAISDKGDNFCDFLFSLLYFLKMGNNVSTSTYIKLNSSLGLLMGVDTHSGSLATTQRAHNVKMTSYQRRCDVITSHRR